MKFLKQDIVQKDWFAINAAGIHITHVFNVSSKYNHLFSIICNAMGVHINFQCKLYL